MSDWVVAAVGVLGLTAVLFVLLHRVIADAWPWEGR